MPYFSLKVGHITHLYVCHKKCYLRNTNLQYSCLGLNYMMAPE